MFGTGYQLSSLTILNSMLKRIGLILLDFNSIMTAMMLFGGQDNLMEKVAMARKVYRCLTGDCKDIARCFETKLLLDFHLLSVHGVDTDMMDIDTLAEYEGVKTLER